jgi:thioester reductase-like protein
MTGTSAAATNGGSAAAHTLTGANGFIGAALVLELLDRTSAEVFCLVRGKDGEEPGERLTRTLTWTAGLYDRPDLVSAIDERCYAIPFDLGDSPEATARRLPSETGELWHVAASLKFKDEDRDEIIDQNVGGTQRALELAAMTSASAFNYVSTAYVSGTRTGRILEEVGDDTSVANNAYEESKIRAEVLVHDFDRLPTRIMRPSIVIGHSRTHAALSGAGLYGMTRGVRRVRTEVAERLGAFLAHRPLRMRGDAEAPINLVPIDVVARNAVAISLARPQARVFHLVNAEPPPVEVAGAAVWRVLGMAPPRWVDDTSEFSTIDEKFDEEPRTRFFQSYISASRFFDLTNTNAAVGEAASVAPLDEAELTRFVRWYVDFLDELRAQREGSQAPGGPTAGSDAVVAV